MYADKDAEFRLLAACLAQPSIVGTLRSALFTGTNVDLFHAFQESYKRYGAIVFEYVQTITPVPSELFAARVVEVRPLIDYLASLALRRQLYARKQEIDARLADPTLLTFAEAQKLLHLDPLLQQETSHIQDAVLQFLGEQQQRHTGTYRSAYVGIRALEPFLFGEWPRSGLTTITAKPGGGKTALACQSAVAMAKRGIPCLFVSLEMAKSRIVPRILAHLSNIPSHRVRTGAFTTSEEHAAFTAALEELQQLPLYIVDAERPLSMSDIAGIVHDHVYTYDVLAVFVDYLQIVVTDQATDSLFDRFGQIATQLRDLARQYKIAVIALSQRNRQHSGLDALLGSSVIGQVSDVVLELSFFEYTSPRSTSLELLKNRDGNLGVTHCLYYPETLTFV